MDQKIQEKSTGIPSMDSLPTRELLDLNSMKTEALRLYTFHRITEHEYEALMKILEGQDRDSHELARLLMKEFRNRSKNDRGESDVKKESY